MDPHIGVRDGYKPRTGVMLYNPVPTTAPDPSFRAVLFHPEMHFLFASAGAVQRRIQTKATEIES